MNTLSIIYSIIIGNIGDMMPGDVHTPRIISPMLPIIILYIMLKVFTPPVIHFKHYIQYYNSNKEI